MDILCTHPMFGPDSGKGSWKDLNFMYETVRCGHDAQRAARIENFLKVGTGASLTLGSLLYPLATLVYIGSNSPSKQRVA